jgi:predicted Zn-dependent protease
MDQFAPADARCTNPEGVRQLDAVVARLSAAIADSPYTIRAAIVDRKPVNAFAAPGGYVILFRGLVERAGRPEEVAGVLAHEIQHIEHRHATRALVRQASTGLLLAAITGDASGVFVYGVEAARTLGTLRYSRQAEEEADLEGLRLLEAAGIDPSGMVTFFETLQRTDGDLAGTLGYLSTHPSTTERIARLRAAIPAPAAGVEPLLSPEGWAQLRAICAARP